jgi:histidinol-phosphate aminotransferase
MVPMQDGPTTWRDGGAALRPHQGRVIGSPNNQTGTIVRKAALARFLEALPEATVLVMDEAYYEYVDDPDYPDSLALVREGRNVIVLRTFSKIYALAGLRVGYGATTPALAAAMDAVREPFNVFASARCRGQSCDPEQVARQAAER